MAVGMVALALKHPGMKPQNPKSNSAAVRTGWVFGTLGMLGFSLTLPMTRMAVQELPPVFVGLGRALIAGFLGAVLLWRRRSPLPRKHHIPGLLLVAAGAIVGFPLLSSLALRHAPASHGAIVVGLLPLATALFGAWFARERPTARFWFAALAGSATVVLFALSESGWTLRPADGLFAVAAILCGMSYAEGGRLSRELGGLPTISWALILVSPITATAVIWSMQGASLHASGWAWGAFAYTGTVSMFLAFWSWYHGLAAGGIARIGQVQLLQVFVTLFWAHLLLDEVVTFRALFAAAAVVLSVAVSRRAAIRTDGAVSR